MPALKLGMYPSACFDLTTCMSAEYPKSFASIESMYAARMLSQAKVTYSQSSLTAPG